MRRDMRWDDNVALFHALQESQEVIPLFIFDPNILFHLPEDDHRVTFLHDTLVALREQIAENGGVLHVAYGDPQTVIQDYITKHNIETIYINHDYEPSAIARDQQVTQIAQDASCIVKTYKDQVIYEKNDILKKDNTPYTIYTPYKNKWLAQFEQDEQITYDTTSRTEKITTISCTMPSLEEIGCSRSSIAVKQYDLSQVATYDQTRDFPDQDTTSYL